MNNRFDFNDWGHYGVLPEEDCLYENTAEILKQALASGEDFDSGWHGFKKELECMRIERVNGVVIVEVYTFMDDFEDLFFDADADDLTEEQAKYVQDLWNDSLECATEYSDSWQITDPTPSLMRVLVVANDLMRDCGEKLDWAFECFKSFCTYARKEVK